jgi:hypothetical protein
VLVPEWGLPAASLVPLARRFVADVPGARIEPEPRRHAWTPATARVPRLAERLDALARSGGASTIVLLAHGRGGVVARDAAALVRSADHLRIVTIATAHVGPAGGGAPHGVGSLRLLSLYSLHDALVTPPDRSYVSGALNVVVRDDGHFGIVRAQRTAALLREALLDTGAAAAAP